MESRFAHPVDLKRGRILFKASAKKWIDALRISLHSATISSFVNSSLRRQENSQAKSLNSRSRNSEWKGLINSHMILSIYHVLFSEFNSFTFGMYQIAVCRSLLLYFTLNSHFSPHSPKNYSIEIFLIIRTFNDASLLAHHHIPQSSMPSCQPRRETIQRFSGLGDGYIQRRSSPTCSIPLQA